MCSSIPPSLNTKLNIPFSHTKIAQEYPIVDILTFDSKVEKYFKFFFTTQDEIVIHFYDVPTFQ